MMNDKKKNSSDTAARAQRYPSWGDMLVLLGVFVVATFMGYLVSGILIKTGSASEGFAIFLAYSIQFALTLVFAVVQKRFRAPQDKPLLRFTFKSVNPAITLWGLILCLAIGIVVEPLISFFPDTYFDSLSRMMGAGGWMLVTTLVLAPFLEEMLFRGVVQEALTTKFGPLRGIPVAALIFGIVHINPPQALNAFFIGLVLGYIYYTTRSLIPVILIHAVNNGIAYFSWILSGEKLVSTRDLIGNPSIYSILYVVACVIFLIAAASVVRVIRKERRKKEMAELAALEYSHVQEEETAAHAEEISEDDTKNGNPPL